ncbi:hypothetical protein GCM10010123_36600 [Pilimelia anulata]|uniref:Uncharacterized protein n=1 Tax=Pilimelia anulata TaxID=53371 RepID=A0A8J3FD88_9ACTN|nr:hypothetical protein [Pilimelia anulata]GGK03347.1 hypothetical protein GCM10010123_36600 [Pilimelia anulata]
MTANAVRILTAAGLVVALGSGSAVAAAAPPAPVAARGTAPYCYDEPVTAQADISDVRSAFKQSNWLPTIQAMYKRRWPSGEGLATAQAKDKYFDQFVKKESFEALAESMMVAIHEETHMWDLDPSRTSWNKHMGAWINNTQQAAKVPLHGGFPRKEILPLIKDNLTSSMDETYLKDKTQGEYFLQGVMAELNAGLMGLPAATVVGEYIKGVGASNSRDIVATNMLYLQLYLRVAKSSHADYWAKIKNEPALRELVLTEFLRGAYWQERAAAHPAAGKLGGPNATKIIAKNYDPANIAILEEFTGRKLRVQGGQLHCTAD